jgi:hypothetical protein
MTRFIIKGTALALAVMLTGTAIIIMPGGYLHELAAIINKRDMLVSRKPPRLILLGGSNLLSLNGPLLERELNMPVVNMGLFFMIPLEDCFDDITRYFSPGDIVVIVQEYESLIVASNGTIDETERLKVEQFMFLLSPYKYTLRCLKRGAPFDVARMWVSLIQLKLKAFIKFGTAGKIGLALTPGAPRYDQLFDANGDRRSPFLILRPLVGDGEKYPEPGPGNIAHLLRMIEDGKTRGVRVFFSFPPIPESIFNLNRRQLAGLFDIMKKNMPVALINSPADQCYPDGDFADTVCHLISKSEQIRSRKLAEALKNQIK